MHCACPWCQRETKCASIGILQITLQEVDLTGHSADAQESLLDTMITAEGRQPFDLVRGPLLRAQLREAGGRKTFAAGYGAPSDLRWMDGQCDCGRTGRAVFGGGSEKLSATVSGEIRSLNMRWKSSKRTGESRRATTWNIGSSN